MTYTMAEAGPYGGEPGSWPASLDKRRIESDAWGEYYKVAGDGNCAFRCLSLAIFRDENMYDSVRAVAACYAALNWDMYRCHVFFYQCHTGKTGMVFL